MYPVMIQIPSGYMIVTFSGLDYDAWLLKSLPLLFVNNFVSYMSTLNSMKRVKKQYWFYRNSWRNTCQQITKCCTYWSLQEIRNSSRIPLQQKSSNFRHIDCSWLGVYHSGIPWSELHRKWVELKEYSISFKNLLLFIKQAFIMSWYLSRSWHGHFY